MSAHSSLGMARLSTSRWHRRLVAPAALIPAPGRPARGLHRRRHTMGPRRWALEAPPSTRPELPAAVAEDAPAALGFLFVVEGRNGALDAGACCDFIAP
eukprot:4735631-Pyramimonas_sp.AAC.1